MTVPSASVADAGLLALRVRCSRFSNAIEIEPYIAWNDGNSQYQEFGADEAEAMKERTGLRDTFYSFSFKEQEFIYAPCQAKERTLNIFVTHQQQMTVTEQGKAPLESFSLREAWNNLSQVVYVLRSTAPGQWNACVGPKAAGYDRLQCMKLDPPESHRKPSVDPAAKK